MESSKEIVSPECPPVGSLAIFAGEATATRRQNLQFHFAQSDERQFKGIGGDYVAGGATPVNIWGKPIDDLPKTGGWVAAFFIFGMDFHSPFRPPLACSVGIT